MRSNKHYIAYTIMMKDTNNRIKFLVEKKKEGYSFPLTATESKKTALACVIRKLKEVVSFDVDNLDLAELTNAIVHENRIPLYVFNYENSKTHNEEVVIKDVNHLEWIHYEELASTFNEWEIDGVPLLSTDY